MITANQAVRELLRQLSEDQLDLEYQAFARHHEQLVKTHLGHSVAFHQATMIDSDLDQRTLYMRVHQRLPHATIGIFPVRATLEIPEHQFIGNRVCSYLYDRY